MSRTGARLGQHFLTHQWAAGALAHAAHIQPGETIVEVGPGKGILTKELLKHGRVLAIEKDEELSELLKETFKDKIKEGHLTLIDGDVRDFIPETYGLESGSYVVAANIPYYITGEIIRQFLTAKAKPRALALLIQKEVAQRIVSTKESLLSLSVKAYGTPKIVEKVSKKHFSPPPKVDSAIILIDMVSDTFFKTMSEEVFFKVLHAGFASKRKTLVNNLSVVFEKELVLNALAQAGIPEKSRAEEVHLSEWSTLIGALINSAKPAERI